MWIAITAQVLTCAIALGLLWKDSAELAKKYQHLPVLVLLATLVLTGLSCVMVVNADRQDAVQKGAANEARTTLGTILDQNRALQQEVANTEQACKSVKGAVTREARNPVTRKPVEVPTIINAPGGIPIVGNQGTVSNPTVNNYGPLPRHLLDQTKTELIECLKKKPGRFSVGAVANNGEAYKYADDWRSVFLSAGWEIEHKDIPIQIFMIGGGTWSGMQIRVHDASPTHGQMAIAVSSPELNASQCLLNMNGQIPGGGSIIPYKDFPAGSVRVDVSDQPQK